MSLDIDAEVVVKCNLLLETDHYEHEDIIRFLQDSKEPYAIPFLDKAISLKPKLEYLDYDDYGSYYKKCLWALASLNTESSIAIIRKHTTSKIRTLRD